MWQAVVYLAENDQEKEIMRDVILLEPMEEGVRSSVLPAVGAALTWAGREILPRLANLWPDRQKNQLADGAHAAGTQVPAAKGSGQQHRHRARRGGV